MNQWIVLIAAVLVLMSFIAETILIVNIPTVRKERHWLRLFNWGYAVAFGLLVGELASGWS